MTAELNIHLEGRVSTKTPQRNLHRPSIHGMDATAKTLITENNAKKKSYVDNKTWTSDEWKYITR